METANTIIPYSNNIEKVENSFLDNIFFFMLIIYAATPPIITGNI